MVFGRPAFLNPPTAAATAPPEAPDAEAAARVLDLLPVCAAIVVERDGALLLEAVNQAFRRSGLGATGSQSPVLDLLGDRLRAFLRSDATEAETEWLLGEAVDCRYFSVRFARRAANRSLPRCLVTLVDRTPERRTEMSLRREMTTDALTGLPNRTGFADLLDDMLADGFPERLAVLAIDLDRFSRVNACMGSLVGDEVLISVARRLRGVLRGRDILARTAGDEFAILLTMVESGDDALQVADRIRAALAHPFRLSEFEIRVDCALGVALGAEAVDSNEDLIRHAQFAVKRAKNSGRTEVYQPKAFDIVRTQFSIETELRHALEADALELRFQPICDFATGRIVSFESLARWRRVDGTDISPCEFIPVAEEAGLIVPLGRWAMETAARTLSLWDAAAGGTSGVSVAVNLSAVQLQRDQVATMVEQSLSRHRIGGERLTLELTESAIVSDPDRTTKAMHALKELGATLAMDDFGTGYSNLAYLQKLPIDLLKIDRSFVSGMLADRDKVAIVRAILSLAQALGMRTTAEGVETPELEQTLAALGCTYGQGFLYARPLDADAAYALLVERNR